MHVPRTIYTLHKGNNENSLELNTNNEIIASQELDQHFKIPTTKAKGYILPKRAKDKSKRLYPSYIKE